MKNDPSLLQRTIMIQSGPEVPLEESLGVILRLVLGELCPRGCQNQWSPALATRVPLQAHLQCRSL